MRRQVDLDQSGRDKERHRHRNVRRAGARLPAARRCNSPPRQAGGAKRSVRASRAAGGEDAQCEERSRRACAPARRRSTTVNQQDGDERKMIARLDFTPVIQCRDPSSRAVRSPGEQRDRHSQRSSCRDRQNVGEVMLMRSTEPLLSVGRSAASQCGGGDDRHLQHQRTPSAVARSASTLVDPTIVGPSGLFGAAVILNFSRCEDALELKPDALPCSFYPVALRRVVSLSSVMSSGRFPACFSHAAARRDHSRQPRLGDAAAVGWRLQLANLAGDACCSPPSAADRARRHARERLEAQRSRARREIDLPQRYGSPLSTMKASDDHRRGER